MDVSKHPMQIISSHPAMALSLSSMYCSSEDRRSQERPKKETPRRNGALLKQSERSAVVLRSFLNTEGRPLRAAPEMMAFLATTS